jgi:hypothetical protein
MPSSDKKKPASAPWKPPGESPDLFDFKQNCGVDVKEETNNPIYTQMLQSQNIVTEGDLLNFSYRVEASASLDIQSTKGSSKATVDVKLNKVIDKSTQSKPLQSLILAIGARIATNARAGTTESTAIPSGEWLKLTNGSNPEWKDLLCVVTGSRTHKITSKSGNHTINFSPGLANSVNPMASAEQYKKELGNGRTLNVSATVENSPKSYNGTVTLKPVAPSAAFTDPLTNETRAVNADSAWEITTQFEKGDKRIENLSNVMTFYINHSKKRFEAIVQKNTALEKQEPPVILLPSN